MSTQRKPVGRVVAFRAPADIYRELKVRAKASKRTRSNLLLVLVKYALAEVNRDGELRQVVYAPLEQG